MTHAPAGRYCRGMGKPSNIYFPMDHTPEQWRAMAARGHERAAGSFQQCDTDGYLSQWASTVMAHVYATCADVAAAGGVWEFDVLADANGAVIDGAREVRTRHGVSWVTPDGQWFTPSRAANASLRERRDLAKGFRMVRVTLPAVVVNESVDSGLGCYPVVVPRRRTA